MESNHASSRCISLNYSRPQSLLSCNIWSMILCPARHFTAYVNDERLFRTLSPYTLRIGFRLQYLYRNWIKNSYIQINSSSILHFCCLFQNDSHIQIETTHHQCLHHNNNDWSNVSNAYLTSVQILYSWANGECACMCFWNSAQIAAILVLFSRKFL